MPRFALGICALATAVAIPASAQQANTPAAVRSGTARAGAAGAVARAAAPARATTPTVLPGTPEAAFTTIQGNALDSSNQTLPDSPVRLRDARQGRIVDSQVTDKSGLFAFRTVDPGSYVVELMSATGGTVLAASQILNVNAGEAVTAVVKLPFRLPPFGGLLGHNAAQAATIASAAAATGVLTEASTTDVSLERLP
jgi:hypothetical protein